jgi:hypothetical protein
MKNRVLNTSIMASSTVSFVRWAGKMDIHPNIPSFMRVLLAVDVDANDQNLLQAGALVLTGLATFRVAIRK